MYLNGQFTLEDAKIEYFKYSTVQHPEKIYVNLKLVISRFNWLDLIEPITVKVLECIFKNCLEPRIEFVWFWTVLNFVIIIRECRRTYPRKYTERRGVFLKRWTGNASSFNRKYVGSATFCRREINHFLACYFTVPDLNLDLIATNDLFLHFRFYFRLIIYFLFLHILLFSVSTSVSAVVVIFTNCND